MHMTVSVPSMHSPSQDIHLHIDTHTYTRQSCKWQLGHQPLLLLRTQHQPYPHVYIYTCIIHNVYTYTYVEMQDTASSIAAANAACTAAPCSHRIRDVVWTPAWNQVRQADTNINIYLYLNLRVLIRSIVSTQIFICTCT